MHACWPWRSRSRQQRRETRFYSRPNGSSPENVWGDNIVGARGNDEFFHPEVVAANHFRAAMIDQDETITLNDDMTIVAVNRGRKGMLSGTLAPVSSYALYK